MTPEIVEIKWLDASRANFDWEEYEPAKLEEIVITSVGFKLNENKEIIEICQSFCERDEDKLFVLAIPRRSILYVSKIS